MIRLNLNNDWRGIKNQILNFDFEMPSNFEIINLPYDMLVNSKRNYDVPFGSYNGYYEAEILTLYRELDKLPKFSKAILDLSGVRGVCDVYINEIRVKTVRNPVHNLIDITDFINQNKNIIKLVFRGKIGTSCYQGLGISGDAHLLIYESPLHILPYGVYVKTEKADSKAAIKVFAEVKNDYDSAQHFELFAEVFNQKKKRVAKKIKKVKLPAGAVKIFELPVNITSHYDWNNYDPYIYGLKVSIQNINSSITSGDFTEENFGIVTAKLSGKSLKLNDKPIKLKGAVVMHDNGIMGNVSTKSLEEFKLNRIKDLGFNAVRYIGCPSDAVLNTVDSLGLCLIVDLFDVWSQGSFVGDGQDLFAGTYLETVEMSVKALRNHPSVIMYSLGNDIEESYGRADGIKYAKSIIEKIKQFDADRILTANAFERIPLLSELESAELKVPKNILLEEDAKTKLLSLSREKDLFKNKTGEFFSLVDVAGYSYLYQRYSLDKNIPDRILIGLANDKARMYDSFDETDKTVNVIGDFIYCAADFIGSNPVNPAAGVKPHINSSGLLDINYNKKDIAFYSEILLKKKSESYILVENPEDSDDNTEKELLHLWNYPKHIGKPVKIIVYTAGDIVALFLDGKPVGRKLAGKFNQHKAEFKTNFYPGKLEAISYHKGIEQSRAVLESVTSPKLIKIECEKKTIKGGDFAFIDIMITDKEGRLVPYANREAEVTVSGEGELVALGNSNTAQDYNIGSNIIRTYQGRARAVVRGNIEGKILIKVTSEGLITNKATVKVK